MVVIVDLNWRCVKFYEDVNGAKLKTFGKVMWPSHIHLKTTWYVFERVAGVKFSLKDAFRKKNSENSLVPQSRSAAGH